MTMKKMSNEVNLIKKQMHEMRAALSLQVHYKFTTTSDRGTTSNQMMMKKIEELSNEVNSIKKEMTAAPTNEFTTTSDRATPTASNLLRELMPLAADWKTIGTLLEVPDGTLDVIQHDNPHRARDCLREMLREWLKGDTSPSWEKVVEAVKLIDKKIAAAIHRKYCSPE